MKQHRFVTLTKSDLLFKKFLLGSFSASHRAIPVKSFNVGTQFERVTFEVLDRDGLKSPSFIELLTAILRLPYLSLAFAPVLTVCLIHYFQGQLFSVAKMCTILFAILFVHMSAFLWNDFFDHIGGVDRVSHSSGSRLIQNGWLTAVDVRKWALFFLLAALTFAISFIVQNPVILFPIGLFVLISPFAFSYVGLGLKYRGLGESIVFMCFGPLITFAVEQALYQKWSFLGVFVGVLFGWAATVLLQLKNWKNIMTDDLAGVKTFICRMGFDRSKYLLVAQLGILCLLSTGLFLFDLIQPLVFFLFFLVWVFYSILLAFKILKVPSPLSSTMQEVYRLGCLFHWRYAALVMCTVAISHWAP